MSSKIDDYVAPGRVPDAPDPIATNITTEPGSHDVEQGATNEKENKEVDPNLVAFVEPFDASNPRDWRAGKKWMVTSAMSATSFLRILVSTIMAPAIISISMDLHMTNIQGQLSMSVYLLASAFGPLVLSPLSEVYGRAPVLHASNIWFLIWNILCGFSRHKGELIAARCLAGFGGSVAYALSGAVLGDIWRPEQRGRSLALYSLIPLVGAAIGPIAGGYITQFLGWHWVFHITSITQGILILATFVMYHETFGPIILARRAKQLRKTTRNLNIHTATERLNKGRTAQHVLVRSLTRPTRLLMFHPLVQLVTVYQAWQYGILYLVLTTYSQLWTEQYHQSTSISGLHYIALTVGEIVGAQIGGPTMDYIFRKFTERNGGTSSPEYHMPLAIPGGIVAPIGLFIYGWTAQAHTYWLAVDIGVFVLTAGLQLAGQAILAYVIDAYPDHTGSATAASQFFRSLTAFSFPLFAPQLYNSLGNGWGNSLLAFLAIAISIPIPVFIWIFGARLRNKAGSSH